MLLIVFHKCSGCSIFPTEQVLSQFKYSKPSEVGFSMNCQTGEVVTTIWGWRFLESPKSILSPLVVTKLLVCKAIMELGEEMGRRKVKMPQSSLFLPRLSFLEDLQDGGRVRRGDHLPLHKYIRNTSTCGRAPTGHQLNAGRRPQTSQKARNSPRTWVGQKKKETTETKE